MSCEVLDGCGYDGALVLGEGVTVEHVGGGRRERPVVGEPSGKRAPVVVSLPTSRR
jgi:hypothetical protein